MEELLLSSEIKVGQLVTGEVIGINGKELILDIKQFAEGHMYINEYDSTLDSFNGVVSVGDKVECVVMKISENDSHSAIYLSRLPLIKQANNEKMGALCDSNEIIKIICNNYFIFFQINFMHTTFLHYTAACLILFKESGPNTLKSSSK